METQQRPGQLTPEEKRAALEAKYQARGAYISEETFKDWNDEVPFSISLDGREGTGKTQFYMLTMPRPLVVINFGDRSPLQFFYRMSPEERKDIKVFDLQAKTSSGFTEAEGRVAVGEMADIIDAYAANMRGGTFALDGGSSWWSVMQQVFVEPKQRQRELAGEKQVGGIVYEEANGRVRGVIGYLKSQGIYLAMTHQMKQDWDAKGPIPNQYSPRKNSQIPGLMEVEITTTKRCVVCSAPDCQNPQHVGRKHYGTIKKLSGNTALEGTTLEGLDLDFSTVYRLQNGREYPGNQLPASAQKIIDQRAAQAKWKKA